VSGERESSLADPHGGPAATGYSTILMMGKVKTDRERVRLHNYRTKYSQDAVDKIIQAVNSGMSVSGCSKIRGP
jgi:hypothetical protein